MNHLLRGHAPISDGVWKELDEEATERLTPALAARKLVDFSGPHGWEYSATNLGRVSSLQSPPCAGVTGPYGLALGREQYRLVAETGEDGGYPLLDHLRKILDGPLVWAPGVKGAVVVSLRGGDFLYESGQDLSIGYDSHDADVVRLYLEQSFSFHVATPEAAVALTV
jgi:uncharacterized linocin/CFP29 family protein